MSLLSSPNVQVWDNLAFDDAGDGSSAGKTPWRPLRPISLNRPRSPEKENRSPSLLPNPKPSPAPSKKPLVAPSSKPGNDDEALGLEIAEIEREIGRLSSRLEALRIKKADRDASAAAAARRGRIVPAKFMESSAKRIDDSPATARFSQSWKKSAEVSALKKIEESPATARSRRRGLSLGPLEIHGGGAGSRPPEATPTPLKSVQTRRKSCFQKLDGIDEEKKGVVIASRPSVGKTSNLKVRQRGLSLGPSEIANLKNREAKEKAVKKEKGRSLSVSPKSRRRSIARANDLRKGIATVGAKKPVKREDESSLSLKPKKLFQEEKSQVTGKRPNAKVRFVASRYSLITTAESGNKRRKWSLPEPGKEERGTAKKRSMSLGGPGLQAQLKMEGEETETSPSSIMRIAEMLPRIKTVRNLPESPRDSGPAKRVAELEGRKSHFGAADGEEMGGSACQSLDFEDEE